MTFQPYESKSTTRFLLNYQLLINSISLCPSMRPVPSPAMPRNGVALRSKNVQQLGKVNLSIWEWAFGGR